MASQALYRRYRSQTFDELIGQEHIVQTLRNALAEGRIAHAYLFTGPRGVGKTTVARLLAKAVNCTAALELRPCGACESCRAVADGRAVDVIEMDAASHTSVEDAREIIERVQFRPTSGEYKVYVIDECFRYEELVTLADGSKHPIGRIVEEQWQTEVLSYNEKTCQLEPKPIVRHMRKQPALPMVRITLNNNRAIICTLNHKFYTPQGLLRAGELEPGQFVYANFERMTRHQIEVVAGAALGDGHLGLTDSRMRGRLSVTHGVTQKPYLDYKVQLLGDLVQATPYFHHSLQSYSKTGVYRISTTSRPQFAQLHGLSVIKVKKIERVPSTEYVYNIEVADNHNYFVRDILVSNCHMLSTAAFNSLLKTLEEPPPHALFVLATTEVHKVPATILSRCQRFTFNRHTVAATALHLHGIAAEEQFTLEPGVAESIARAATGSMRDALSVLDQLMAYGSGTITLEQVRGLIGATEAQEVAALVDALIGGDLAGALRAIAGVAAQGADLRQFTRDLVERLRALMLLKAGGDRELIDVTDEDLAALEHQAAAGDLGALLQWVKLFSGLDHQLRTSAYGQLPLELAVVEAIAAPASPSISNRPGAGIPAAQPAPAHPAVSPAAQQRAAAPAETPRPIAPAHPAVSPPPEDTPPPEGTPRTAAPPPTTPPPMPELPIEAYEPEPPAYDADPLPNGAPVPLLGSAALDVGEIAANNAAVALLERVEESWDTFLRDLRAESHAVHALIKGCRPIDVDGNILVLEFKFPKHVEMLEKRGTRQIVEQVLSKLLYGNYGVRGVVLDNGSASPHTLREQIKNAHKDPHIKKAINIFDADIIEIKHNQ